MTCCKSPYPTYPFMQNECCQNIAGDSGTSMEVPADSPTLEMVGRIQTQLINLQDSLNALEEKLAPYLAGELPSQEKVSNVPTPATESHLMEKLARIHQLARLTIEFANSLRERVR